MLALHSTVGQSTGSRVGELHHRWGEACRKEMDRVLFMRFVQQE